MNEDQIKEKDIQRILELIVIDNYPDPIRLFYKDEGFDILEKLGKKVGNFIDKEKISSIVGLLGAGIPFSTISLYNAFFKIKKNFNMASLTRVPIPYIRPPIKKKGNILVIDDCIYTGYNLRRVKNFLENYFYDEKISYYPIFNISNEALGIDAQTGKDFINDSCCEIDLSQHLPNSKPTRINGTKKIDDLVTIDIVNDINFQFNLKEIIIEDKSIQTWNLYRDALTLFNILNISIDKLKETEPEEKINCVIAASPWAYSIATLIAYVNKLPLILVKKNIFKAIMEYRPLKIAEFGAKIDLRPLILDTSIYTKETMKTIISDFQCMNYIPFSIVARKKDMSINNKKIIYLTSFEDLRK